MYFVARAYSLALASVAAPFEYVSLPINVMWGFVIWQEIPTLMTLIGAFLTLFSGMYVLYREQRERPILPQTLLLSKPDSANRVGYLPNE
jgi:drug/metabolite transporter (DMT)-like permease